MKNMHQVPLDGQPDTLIGFSGIVSPLVDKMTNTKTNAANVNSFEKSLFSSDFSHLLTK